MWIDGNDDLCAANSSIINAIVSDVDDQEVEFIITNNDAMSSSILELKEHKQEHPDCLEVNRIRKTTVRLDTLLKRQGYSATNYDVLVMDVQGAEMHVLKGAPEVLKNIKCIITEVNTKELYAGCVLLDDLDKFLIERGFIRMHINMTRHGWGDAVYVKKAVSIKIHSGLGNQLFHLAFLYGISKQTGCTPILNDEWIQICTTHTSQKDKYSRFYDIFNRYPKLDKNYLNFITENAKYPCKFVDYTTNIYSSDKLITVFEGYFQSTKFFENNIDEVRNMFLNILNKDGKNLPLQKYLNFIHVRGRDHIHQNNVAHKLPKLNVYYEYALKESRCDSKSTVVFTDDMEYTRSISSLDKFNVIHWKQMDELDSLNCMASCSEVAITSNSSFSWWGAFLANSKSVYMPYPFLLNKYAFEDIYYDGVRKINIFLTEKIFDSIVNCRRWGDKITIILIRDGNNAMWITKEDVYVNGERPDSIKIFNNLECNNRYLYNDICIIETNVQGNSDDVILTINGFWKKLDVVKKDKETQVDLVAMTLFKDDAYLIPHYVNYYKKMGVERFYLYYNGTESLDTFPKIENVEYISWGYPYKKDHKHYAQLGAMTDMLYYSRNFAKYVLFNDMDEYITWKPQHISFKEHILTSNYDIYAFLNNFVFVKDGDVININDPTLCLKTFQMQYGKRSKCIVRPTSLQLMGVHEPIFGINLNDDLESRICVLASPTSEMLHVCNIRDRKHVSLSTAKRDNLMDMKNKLMFF
jgi:FkbM family methyltransferase